MLNTLTVGKKIILGFVLLLTIAIILGLVAVIQMKDVEGGAERLANAYVPETVVSNEVERHTMLAMYANRGYGFTENEAYYEEGQAQLSEALESLDRAKELAVAEELEVLKQKEPQARALINNYGALVADTRTLNQQLSDYRTAMDASAGVFVSNVNALIENQEEKLDKDLVAQMSKINWATHVSKYANNARVLNFKAQSMNNMSYMNDAISSIDKALEYAGKLRPNTTHEEDIRMLNEFEGALKDYQSAMSSFLAEERKGSQANALTLKDYRIEMDTSAGVLSKAMESYIDGQIEDTEVSIRERVSKIGWVNDVVDLGNAARIDNFKSQTLRDPKLMKEALANLDSMKPVFDELFQVTQGREDIDMLKATQESAHRYREAVVNFLSAWEQRELVGVKRNEAGMNVLEIAEETALAASEHTSKISNEAHSHLNLASTVMNVGLVIAVIIGVLLSYFITRSITGPLNIAISTLSAGSEQTASASGEVSSASQSLAEGSSEQASSLEETSSSLEEMSSMTRRNAEHATHANAIAAQTRNAAESGVREMEDMSRAMEAIKQSSDDISKIIKTIDEIAFQTNILALNAAVEAARAGEAGQGFAVVADEVRSLAQRSAVAARETAEKIEDAVSKSEMGVGISNRVSASLSEIVTRAREVDKLIAEIASASSEQDQGIHQINEAITQMDQVTQSNAANAEETASASEELSAQAEELRSVVNDLILMVGTKGVDTGSMKSSKSSTASRSYYLKADSAHSAPKKSQAALTSKPSSHGLDEDFKDF